MADYKLWSLEKLRAEASERSINFSSKDGVKTLASKLRVHDKLMTSPGDASVAEEEKGKEEETTEP